MATRQKGMTARLGPMEVDVPRTTGYYVGVGAAVAFGLIEWPVAIFIAAIPVVKMMQSRRLPAPLQFAVHLFDGASQPVGGDSEGTVRLERMPDSVTRAVGAVRRTFAVSPLGSSTTRRRTSRKASGGTAKAKATTTSAAKRSSASTAKKRPVVRRSASTTVTTRKRPARRAAGDAATPSPAAINTSST